jgi:hypothetical protein
MGHDSVIEQLASTRLPSDLSLSATRLNPPVSLIGNKAVEKKNQGCAVVTDTCALRCRQPATVVICISSSAVLSPPTQQLLVDSRLCTEVTV